VDTEFYSENLKHMEELGVDDRIILKWMLRKLG
jgi:hypothetical protein